MSEISNDDKSKTMIGVVGLYEEDVILEQSADDVYQALFEDNSDIDEDVLWLREQRKINSGLHWMKRPAIWKLYLPFFFFLIGQGCSMQVQDLILLKLACNYYARIDPNGKCSPADAQVMVSNLNFINSIIGGIANIYVSTKIGKLSDIYGRRACIVYMVCCLFTHTVLRYLIVVNSDVLHTSLFIIIEFIKELSGGSSCIVGIANCYISDICEPHEKVYYMGLLSGILTAGGSLGPIISNIIVKLNSGIAKPNVQGISRYQDLQPSEYIPLRLEVLFVLTTLILVVVFLVETLPERLRRKSMVSLDANSLQNKNRSWKDIVKNNIKNSLDIIDQIRSLLSPSQLQKVSTPRELRASRISVIFSISFYASHGSAVRAIESIVPLFAVFKFDWGSSKLGYSITLTNVSRAFVLAILTPLLTNVVLKKWIKFKTLKTSMDMVDFNVLALCLTAHFVLLIAKGFVNNEKVFWSVLMLDSISTMIMPTLSALILKFYPENKAGYVFGVCAFISNVLLLIIPPLSVWIYKFGIIHNFPGLSFVFFAGFYLIFLCSLLLLKVVLGLNSSTEDMIILSRTSSTSSIRSYSASDNTNTNVLEQNNEATDKNRTLELHRKNSTINRTNG